nr:MAG TPA: hypothetical protein [Caudoviricetes sp.]
MRRVRRCAKGEPKRRFRASRRPRTKREINRRFRHGLGPPVPDKK